MNRAGIDQTSFDAAWGMCGGLLGTLSMPYSFTTL